VAGETCTICGQVIAAVVSTPAGGPSHASEMPLQGSTVCVPCSQRLNAATRTDRTTILRPIVSLPLTDEAGREQKSRRIVLSPEPQPVLEAPTEKAAAAGESGSEVKDDLGVPVARQFGPYEILNEISRGSFGVVYKARQQGLDRIVALKVLLAGVHASGEAVERFKREARAVARLKHPNIVPVYDIGMHEGHHYFAMEFVEGDALSNLIAVRYISISDALSIAEQLADALETAHHASVIHRDIKPSNILIDKHGKPHITDFGLAKQVDLDTKYTMSGTTLGTPAYMPPEQARGEIDRIDARSDVYAIGAVLYEMLTGRTPFAGRSVLEVVVAVINEPVRPPRQLNPKIHRDVQTIVLKCLEKDSRQRYASAAELRDDLRRFRSGEAIKARPAGILRVAGRAIRRHYVLLGSAVMVAIAIGFSLKAKQDQVQANVETEKMRKQLMVKASNEAVWRPDWWFPPKTPSELQNEETQKLYKIPEGKESFFQGLVKGRDAWELHSEKIKGRDGQPDQIVDKTVKITSANLLVTPEDFRFYGDVDGDIVFRLPESLFKPEAQKQPLRVRIGLQSLGSFKGFDGIPFIVEFSQGNIRVIGPADLYSHTSPSEGEKRGPPRLEVKAEKLGPELIPGEYTLNVHREGTALLFRLGGPSKFPGAAIEIKDANLSNWVFRNTQLVLRDPPPGLQVISAEVRRKYGDDDDPAFRFYRVGDYNVAEAELKVIASGQDAFKRARAKYQLGMIQEICAPALGRELTWYTDALNDLDAMPQDDPRQRDKLKLATELHLRKMIRFAKIKQWNGVIDELNEGWGGGASIGEPLAWELHHVLEMLLKEKEPDANIKIMAALSIFQRLGIEAGSQRFGRWAEELAVLLSAERRFDDLIALHKTYPAPTLSDEFFLASRKALEKNQFDVATQLISYIMPYCRSEKELKLAAEAGCEFVAAAMKTKHYQEASRMFSAMPSLGALKALCQEVDAQVKTIAEDDFFPFLSKVLQPVLASMPKDQAAQKLIDASLDKLCAEIIIAGRASKLQKIHEVVRGPRTLMDSRLSASFARAIQQLAQNGDAGSYAQALALLKYCSAHVAQSDQDIRRSAYALAKPKAKVDENRSYFAILTIQDAYPTPELLNLSRDVMLELIHPQRQRFEEAVMFFSQARVDFGAEARSLSPLALGALEKVRSPDQRMQLMSSIWLTVNGQFEQQHTAAAERPFEQPQIAAAARQWRLEYGDMEMALNLWDRARETYRSLIEPRPNVWSLKSVETELRVKAGLRLGIMALARPGTGNPNEYLLPLLGLDNVADEYKLAARFLVAPEQLPVAELDGHLKNLRAPLLLQESEWDLVRGLRLRMEGDNVAAGAAFRQAESKSSSSRAWLLAVASYLGRPAARSPEEEQRGEEARPGNTPKNP